MGAKVGKDGKTDVDRSLEKADKVGKGKGGGGKPPKSGPLGGKSGRGNPHPNGWQEGGR